MTQKRFVILDRDGTINRERSYLSDPAQVELLPGVVQGLLAMRELGLGLVVATNQSGLARQYFDEARLQEIHARLAWLLAEHDLVLDGIYHCPHLPEAACSCRKPNTGLLLRAALEQDFAPERCFVIGDKACDIHLGQNAGTAATFLVRTGYGREYEKDPELRPDFVVDDLAEAARIMAGLLEEERLSACLTKHGV